MTRGRAQAGFVAPGSVDRAGLAHAADTLSGETFRERQRAAAAGASTASAYRFTSPVNPFANHGKSRTPRHVDPNAAVDNYIPVARGGPTDGITAPDVPVSAAGRKLRSPVDGPRVTVEMAGEEAVDPTGSDIGDGNVTISGKSALFRSVVAPLPLSSRQGKSTWSTVPRASPAVEKTLEERSTPEELAKSEGHALDRFDNPALEHMKEAVQYSTSIYTKKALVVDGVSGYHDVITRREEEDIVRELTPLLTNTALSHFEATEGRYCVNLFEKDLGVATEAPAALALSRSAPTLQRVLRRFFEVGLIPAIPNTAQVSEYVSPFGGYRPHVKHPSIGPYIGVISLLSDSLMVLQHIDQPWVPQIDVVRRSAYVVTAPALTEYRIGYPDLDRAVRTHQHRSRLTKDYRLEILFATVDAPRVPAIADVLKLSERREMHRSAQAAKDAGVRGFTKGGRTGEGPLEV